jgi:tetratricopeptide (TPR) repeat protein
MIRILTDSAIVCTFALAFGAIPVAAQIPPTTLDSAQVAAWREDLAFMAREMEQRHRNLYHTVSRAAFDSAVAALDHRIPSLQRHQIIIELARIVALVQDGHTNVAPTRDPKIGFSTLPVKLYFFQDGLFIRAAHRSQAGLAGAKILRIGRFTPDQAYARVRELVGRDNEMDARFFAPFLLAMPEVLHGLGISSRVDQATFEIERAGRRETVTLRAVAPAFMMPPDTDVSWWPDSSWTDMRRPGPRPLWLRENPLTEYWAQYLPDERMLYVQYNKVANKEGEPLPQFSRRIRAMVDSAPVERVVLDLRLNRGGNGTLNRPLVRSLIAMRKLEGPGKLFVLIGRSTFSAAQFLVNDLEQYTDAVFVGEPTGGKANSYGDSRKITLPHSGLTVRVSTLWWQEDPRDTREWKAPDVAAELTSEAYRNNRDPALEAVREYRAAQPLVDRMQAALAGGSAEDAIRLYREYHADPRHRYVDSEEDLTVLGYQLLDGSHFEAAIRVLGLNAAEHPRSTNAHDSLGEAYMRAGRKEHAARSFRRALEIDPKNANARNLLMQLEPGASGR